MQLRGHEQLLRSAPMKLLLLGPGGPTFIDALDEASIQYEVHRFRGVPGMVMNSTGEAIEIIKAAATAAPITTAVAYVLATWIKSRASRCAKITTQQNKVLHIEAQGYSPDQLAELLATAKDIMVLDTEKSEKKDQRRS